MLELQNQMRLLMNWSAKGAGACTCMRRVYTVGGMVGKEKKDVYVHVRVQNENFFLSSSTRV